MVAKKSGLQNGVKGIHSLVCLPHWGVRGHLRIFLSQRNYEQNQVFSILFPS
jgi:hypothetical protein